MKEVITSIKEKLEVIEKMQDIKDNSLVELKRVDKDLRSIILLHMAINK